MIVYRIQKSKYGADISGIGATLASGRWNLSGGQPMLYTASSRSLAILEQLAHLPSIIKPPKLALLNISIPDDSIVVVDESDLPYGWKEMPYKPEVQQWGMDWLKVNSSLAISVPSSISLDQNILVNPSHPRFREVEVQSSVNDFLIDGRLL